MKKENRAIVAHLDDALADLEMAELGAAKGNRHAAFHLQQAAEKLATAIRLMRGLLGNKTHSIETLVKGDGRVPGLPEGDPWIERLEPFFDLSQYATTYRYPTPSGKRKPGPSSEEARDIAKRIRALIDRAQQELSQ